MSNLFGIALRIGAVVLLAAATPKGCEGFKWPKKGLWRPRSARGPAAGKARKAPHKRKVPAPIHLTLPADIRIHSFTGTRTFDPKGGVKGIEVRIEAKDAFGDSTKAFGDFRFELYTFRLHSNDPKGRQLAIWDVPLLKAKRNLLHWNNIHRMYEFRLQWDRPIAVGSRFVLLTVFESPFTERLFAERVFVAGQ